MLIYHNRDSEAHPCSLIVAGVGINLYVHSNVTFEASSIWAHIPEVTGALNINPGLTGVHPLLRERIAGPDVTSTVLLTAAACPV